ncbi:hypothetical protein HN419_01960 [Candidatus Woesearchaeota archaeon]|jgi:hypothetical protein|nr:hypothetical protein [Candidatus Woesearchaeota archaeon]MBT3537238.1 hypothetical protein [Candidatus Woesearchaeota archaeon]MBT7106452.1 hypothetical protein [Candidatus Woesearchaeota archaeon]MBT7931173.1 hypothetical protein [Candidatus Woesearchaeota archaeon]
MDLQLGKKGEGSMDWGPAILSNSILTILVMIIVMAIVIGVVLYKGLG